MQIPISPYTDDPMSVVPQLSWDYEAERANVRSLYNRGKAGQWNAETDIDWSCELPFGHDIPPGSWPLAMQGDSPITKLGKNGTNKFRWEFQSWMVCQFLHGEQGALLASCRLAEVLPSIDGKLYAANQAADEARHLEAFSRYANDYMPEPYEIAPGLKTLLAQSLGDSRWDFVALGMQVLIEGIAMGAFRTANVTFHDPLLRRIIDMVIRDESRHVSFGMFALEGLTKELSGVELAEREDFILEGGSLLRRRFLMEDLWERLGIDVSEGVNYAENNPVMIAYRKTVFAKLFPILKHIDLLTPRVVDGFRKLQLIGAAGERAIRTREVSV